MTESSLKRLKVLEYSLTMEVMASFALAFLLDIDYEKIGESKSLGNTSSSLSFNQKLNLLLDNDSITKEEKVKLEAFMNIRNQFMHNKSADSYSKAVGFISGLINRLKKLYPGFFIEGELEDSIEKCVVELYNDSLSILGDFKGGRKAKLTMQSEREVYFRKYNILKEAMESEIDRLYQSVINKETDLLDKKDLSQKLGLLKFEIILKANKTY